jgi:hypothetical protein
MKNYDDMSYTHGIQIFTLCGRYHRTDGPAYIDIDASRSRYYLYGKFYTKSDYDVEIQRLTAVQKTEIVKTAEIVKKYRVLLDGVEYSANVIEYL